MGANLGMLQAIKNLNLYSRQMCYESTLFPRSVSKIQPVLKKSFAHPTFSCNGRCKSNGHGPPQNNSATGVSLTDTTMYQKSTLPCSTKPGFLAALSAPPLDRNQKRSPSLEPIFLSRKTITKKISSKNWPRFLSQPASSENHFLAPRAERWPKKLAPLV